MYDVIVIGARCAGASTAMLLARAGLSVLLVDRARLPSDVPRGHLIHQHGPRRLHDWGLLDAVLATGCPAITSITTEMGDFPLRADGLEADGVPVALGPRHARLDDVLVQAAVHAGAELRDGFAVDGVTADGRVTGIRGRDIASRRAATDRAAVVVGADGRNSLLARQVGAPVQVDEPTVSCWYFSYWADVPADGLEIYHGDQRAIFAFPTNDELFAVFVAFPIAELAAVRADPDAAIAAAVARVPSLQARLREGRRAERYAGATQLPNFLRRAAGPGWALAGDAACHKDPYLALGVCDALRDAELLSGAITAGLSGERPLDDALEDYADRHAEHTLPDFRENLGFARLQPPPPEVHALRAAIRDDPVEARRFALAREGIIPREEFFSPENLRRIMSAAMRSARLRT